MSHPLDRRQPLWEMWLIEGLSDDRWATPVEGAPLHGRRHRGKRPARGAHGSRARRAAAHSGRMEPRVRNRHASNSRATRRTWRSDPMLTVARDGVHALRHPADALDRARDVALGVSSHDPSRPCAAVRRSPGRSGPIAVGHARTCLSTTSRQSEHAFGGTVNDVVLPAVTRGFRGLFVARVARRSMAARSPRSFRFRCGAQMRAGRSTIAFGRLRAASDRYRGSGRNAARDPRAHGSN